MRWPPPSRSEARSLDERHGAGPRARLAAGAGPARVIGRAASRAVPALLRPRVRGGGAGEDSCLAVDRSRTIAGSAVVQLGPRFLLLSGAWSEGGLLQGARRQRQDHLR